MDFGSRDMISSLPDALICYILSFLSTKEAASTSVLSKRWRFLFVFVKNLDFDDSVYLHSRDGKQDKTPTSFMEFVDRVLALQGNDTINKFSPTCNDYDVDPVRVTSWIFNVLGRGVSDLDLSLVEYSFPFKIFVSKTLVRLKLVPGVDYDYVSFTIDVEDVFLPKLKTLHLNSVKFEEDDVGFAKFLSGCPVLEELVLMNLGWENWNSCSVSITTLKRLTFFCEDRDQNPRRVSFDTPNLEYLKYYDTVAEKYQKVNFDSLVEASLGLRLSSDQNEYACFPEYRYFGDADEEKELVGSATDFLMAICNVQILYLSASAVQVLRFCCETTPVFNNLHQLTVESGWELLPCLLKNCPNLETLVLKGGIPIFNNRCEYTFLSKSQESVPSWLFSSPVKVIKIYTHGYINDPVRLEQMRQTMEENMPRLEQVIVYHNASSKDNVF